jgi:hypothetical protein
MFINQTQIIGQVIGGLTTNITGHEYLTYLMVIILVFALCFMFRIPIEITAMLMIPLLLVLMIYDSSFRVIGGCVLILLGILFVRPFFNF